jgi:hypothetical protein
LGRDGVVPANIWVHIVCNCIYKGILVSIVY